MINAESLIKRDLAHFWHPCSQMKDFEKCPPLIVKSAKGCIINTNHGPLIDAISSWWCKSLGHNHPAITEAINSQLAKFSHTITANTTFPKLIELTEELAKITGLQHAQFASDGSCAVEIAMKLALHANQIKGNTKRTQFLALENSYHGETLATLALSDLGLYKKPYQAHLQNAHFLRNIPYVTGVDDPLWHNCDKIWPAIESQLESLCNNLAAIVIEPIVQGAAGMLCYSADFLKKLCNFAQKNNIFIIADEIMTGFGRTGHWLASNHAQIHADMVCLSKGLTSGTLPLSVTMISHDIYDLFYDDYEKGNNFLHSHTYSGNALAVSAALATINVIKDEGIITNAADTSAYLMESFKHVANISGKITNIRGIGCLVAGDLIETNNKRMGFKLYQQALKHGTLLRPLGNTIYWLPPINIDKQTISQLAQSTLQSLKGV